jgi:3-deoxy-manno-octulosonate cytidylyltransferase (CMP-KDO synthetase)
MSTSPRIVAIIPARYGSVRLPAKPLVDLCGKPMIQRVVEQVRSAQLVSRAVVATDDERIAAIIRGIGAEAVITSSALRTGSDRVAAAAALVQDADIIVNVQGDEPLIPPAMIDEAVRLVVNNPGMSVGTVVRKITSAGDLENPNVVKVVVDRDNNAIYFSRSAIPYLRDTVPAGQWHRYHTYYKHFGLYVYRRQALLDFAGWPEGQLERIEKLEQLRIIERGIRIGTVCTGLDSIAVDTAEDAERVRQILRAQETSGVK